MKTTVICSRNHQFTYKTTEKENRELQRSLVLHIKCPHPGCESIVRLTMVDGLSTSPEPGLANETQRNSAPTPAPLSDVAQSPLRPPAAAPPFTPFPPQQRPAPPAERPGFVPARRDPGIHEDRPPFPPNVPQHRGPKGGPWQRFYAWFSGLPQAVQYTLLGLMFCLALLILILPTDAAKVPKPDDTGKSGNPESGVSEPGSGTPPAGGDQTSDDQQLVDERDDKQATPVPTKPAGGATNEQ